MLAACAVSLCVTAPARAVSPLDNTTYTDAGDGRVRAGVGKADTTWHVGASAGQYASTKADTDPLGEIDPSVLAVKNLPSYGIQSRLEARAIVVEGADGKRVAHRQERPLHPAGPAVAAHGADPRGRATRGSRPRR